MKWLDGIVKNKRCDKLSARALLQEDLPANKDYENRPEKPEPVKITQEDQPCCRKYGAPMVSKNRAKMSRFDQDYVLEYYLYCQQCGTSYTVEKAKNLIERPPHLFW